MSNTKSFDVLAINRNNDKQIAIQVKTNHTSKKTWTLSQKNETLLGENISIILFRLIKKIVKFVTIMVVCALMSDDVGPYAVI